MFIKRIDHSGAYRVWECDSYRVEESATDAPHGKDIILFGPGYEDRLCTLYMGRGDVAYVMNDAGRTIDTIDCRACESATTGSVSSARC